MAAHLPGAAPPESLDANPNPSRSRSPSPKPNPSCNPSANPEPCPSPDLDPNPNCNYMLRTYQEIDISASSLINVLEFEGGELRVGSTIAPDEADGSRFNFAFEQCSSRVKVPPWQCPSSAPVPPQGAPGGSGQLGTPRDEAGPLSAQPLPFVLERAASKAALLHCV